MSRRRIKVPPQVVADLSVRALDSARDVGSSLIGVAVVSAVLAIASLAILVLVEAGVAGARWVWAPALGSLSFAIVCCGVALDVVRGLKR